LFALLAVAAAGCKPTSLEEARPDLVWGRHGVGEGRFQKPRAIAVDGNDRLYIVDKQARIQVFTRDGEYLREWRTPAWETGKPTGLSIDRQGRLLVADTHYYRVLIYTPEGKLVQTIGGEVGAEPGQFEYVTDVVQDSNGYYYISQYGPDDFIQKYTADGEYVLRWGGHGYDPGQFMRPQAMAIDEQDRIWVADAANHRIQVFDGEGNLLTFFGEYGSEPGQLATPYGVDFDSEGNLYVCEYENHRIQKFTRDGKSLGCWGRPGRRQEGELWNPWSLCVDSRDDVHVLDSNNHRVQRLAL
jgi:DNA-binding beta-propeller fold protein YncE